MMLKKKILTPVAFLLIAAVLLIPVFTSTPDETVLVDGWPVGFIIGDAKYGNWAYKETDEYMAKLSEIKDGDYFFTCKVRNRPPIYEKIIQSSELVMVEYYIREIKAGRIPPGITQTIIP